MSSTLRPGIRDRLPLLVLSVAVTVGGCLCRKAAVAPPPPPEAPVYRLCVEASPRLNWYSDASHTLYVRMFQLSSLDAFMQSDPSRLLDSQLVLAGVQGSPIERTIYPGTKTVVEVRLANDAQYLGIVTGYYKLEGAAKAKRAVRDHHGKDDDCLHLGPNGVEGS